jgi:hypothetical protein
MEVTNACVWWVHVVNMPWDQTETEEIINDLIYGNSNLIDLDFGFKTYLALLNL